MRKPTTKTRVASPYRFSPRLAALLFPVTGGRFGIEVLDDVATNLANYEREYTNPNRYGVDLFDGAAEVPHQEWGKELGRLSEIASNPLYPELLRRHAVTCHALACPRWALALQLWWNEAPEGTSLPDGYLDLEHEIGHFRWSPTDNRTGWVTTHHYELTREFGLAT